MGLFSRQKHVEPKIKKGLWESKSEVARDPDTGMPQVGPGLFWRVTMGSALHLRVALMREGDDTPVGWTATDHASVEDIRECAYYVLLEMERPVVDPRPLLGDYPPKTLGDDA